MTAAGDDGLLQRQAQALGDRTRHAIFRMIEEAVEPLGVRELTEALGLHPSAIRQHLAKLVGAELVLEDRTVASGPGRPRSLYRRAPGVLGVWRSDNPFERLAALLVDVVRSGGDPRAAGREAGRAIAASPSVAADRAVRAVDALQEMVAVQGFQPVVADEGGTSALVLGHCPYASLAATAPEVVCELHHGLAEGMADALTCAEPIEVTGLARRDPRDAGCRVTVRPRAEFRQS